MSDVRVTEHTRRKPDGPECMSCAAHIQPGERYRQLVAIRHDAFNSDFELWTAHADCVRHEEAWNLF